MERPIIIEKRPKEFMHWARGPLLGALASAYALNVAPLIQRNAMDEKTGAIGHVEFVSRDGSCNNLSGDSRRMCISMKVAEAPRSLSEQKLSKDLDILKNEGL